MANKDVQKRDLLESILKENQANTKFDTDVTQEVNANRPSQMKSALAEATKKARYKRPHSNMKNFVEGQSKTSHFAENMKNATRFIRHQMKLKHSTHHY